MLITIGLIIIGCGINSGLNHIGSPDRIVSVRGLAEQEVKADKVTWPIVYNLLGNDLSTLYTQINTTNQEVLDFLTDNGVDTAEISIDAPSVFDREAQTYTSDRYTYRYTVTQVIVVTSNDVDAIDALIKRQSELLKLGITLSTNDYSNAITYEFTGLNDIKPAMIAEATKNAREAAQKFADDSQSKLGKIKSASQGQFSITDRDEYTPSIKNVRIVTYVDYFLED